MLCASEFKKEEIMRIVAFTFFGFIVYLFFKGNNVETIWTFPAFVVVFVVVGGLAAFSFFVFPQKKKVSSRSVFQTEAESEKNKSEIQTEAESDEIQPEYVKPQFYDESQ